MENNISISRMEKYMKTLWSCFTELTYIHTDYYGMVSVTFN